jgi:D-alanine-D-alanine ligase
MEELKKNIAIVCGGDSSEHDVSMRSAQGIYSFFDKERYNVYIVDVKGLAWHIDFDNGEEANIDKNDFSFVLNGKAVVFDYAYITIHGTPGENGLMQGYFELLHIPYSTSGVLVESMTFNKYVLNNYLRSFGVNVAPSILIHRGEEEKLTADYIDKTLGLPCFVKPAADGSSFGVSKVKNFDQLAPALRVAFMESDEVMAEGFLNGTEISIGCYKTRDKQVVFPATEVVSKNEFFDYDAKYNGDVQEITPARIKPETAAVVAAETSKIYDILHCNGIIRIDYIITKDADGNDKVNMLEINTTPGMTATSFIPQQVKAAGLNITDVLTEIVENQLN